MYQFSYSEIMEDDIADAKSRERQVLDRSIELLQAAAAKGRNSPECIEAIFYTRRVWTRFVEDLSLTENQLDPELRGNLISIAIWIMKELDRIRRRESDNFAGIIEITTIIKDGIK
ncbi:flagellar biosynthesis regulator FlaF [Rhizobium sp. L1K21]|uniref:flagellar biosynthesis regulator FlaF n=1 Tax=Rhizobium sp. L1K21 TaxID=2954933 RepID=UPI00209324CC|nr:flagellar biosynthesis regulator FlaF [Rhizobium sp. L1K21]MCO6187105.1 flagellar biosynthesis regulator FlaF [Rhizobium sp. L1K21]